MKQSILMKTKRSINSIMMMLQLLVMLFAMSLGLSSYAQTGSLTVTRTPSTMIAGQPFTIVWSSSEPTAVATKYSCVSPSGGFAGSATLSVSGSASGTADPNWLWKDSTCTWTVVNAAGSILASRIDIMKTVAAPVNGVTYIHTDGLGSPVAKSDANGNLIAGSRTRYEPYGMTVAGTATPTIGFTGHVNDADTGLTYMQQRYYDPVAGRFLSTDPVITDNNSGASFNRYVYVNNNPYRYIDPDGRDGVNFYTNPDLKLEMGGGKDQARAFFVVTAGAIGSLGGPGAAATAAQIVSNILDGIEQKTGVLRAGVVQKTNVSSDTIICRGGLCGSDAFKAGGPQGPDGKMSQISTGVGSSVAEATTKIKNTMVGVTTVGKITEAGGTVVKDGTTHANVSGLTPTKLAELFKNVIPNPNKK